MALVSVLGAVVPQVRQEVAAAVQGGLPAGRPSWVLPTLVDPGGEGSGGDGQDGAAALHPDLAHAWEHASAEAAAADHPLEITSGYRSPERQQALHEEAILKYGSVEEASRWVLPPDESSHVTGLAIDVGPDEQMHWLAANGARFDLC